MSLKKSSLKLLEPIIFSKKNRQLVEKYVSHYTRTDAEYYDLLYRIVGILLHPYGDGTKRERIQNILTMVHEDELSVWNQPVYSLYKIREEEQLNFIANPIEVEEGVLECGKCGSNRTISFTKQVRSSDESTSVFAQCVECGNKWRES